MASHRLDIQTLVCSSILKCVFLPANMQKFRTPIKGLVAPIPNANKLVSDVIVTEMAEERKVASIRLMTSSVGEV